MDPRPPLHALVGYFCEPFGLLDEPRVMTLEDAADYARFGWTVFVDPQDQEDLARWEQLHRALHPKKKWFERE